MPREPSSDLSAPTGAVFLSYASQDAGAARRICDALRAAGIEVWFDQSELRGGDAWDHKIRDQILSCRLFVPIISASTEQRDEGYFRREWSLAVDRTRDMAHKRTFLVPVVVDETAERGAAVPDKFHEVQWTRLPKGEVLHSFVEHMRRLLTPCAPPSSAGSAVNSTSALADIAVGRPLSLTVAVWIAVVIAAGIIFLIGYRLWTKDRIASSAAGTAPPAQQGSPGAAADTFNPPAHTIAVLPFINISGDKEQEYFSDGLTEELLNSLSRINELQVAARTSSFSFAGEHPDIATVAHKLNVASVLEGSVRRSANTIRVTVQLINGTNGFHLWSQTYDRSLGDVLALQTDIATAIARALKITLLENASGRIELGGTTNPAAFDAFLRGNNVAFTARSASATQQVIAAYSEAVRLDPQFANAFVERSVALANYAAWHSSGAEIRANFDKSLADAREAVRLAPALAEGHYAIGIVQQQGFLQLAASKGELAQALALAPGSARILSAYSRNASIFGDAATAIPAARRAIILDPLNFHVHRTAGIVFLALHMYADAITEFRTAISQRPDFERNYTLLGLAQYALGDFEAARASCEAASADDLGQYCLAMVYWKLGRKADAQAIEHRMEVSQGDDGALNLASIYAQWGDIPRALGWLETAMRKREPGLDELKVDATYDPLRGEPRFQAVLKKLNFPD